MVWFYMCILLRNRTDRTQRTRYPSSFGGGNFLFVPKAIRSELRQTIGVHLSILRNTNISGKFIQLMCEHFVFRPAANINYAYLYHICFNNCFPLRYVIR